MLEKILKDYLGCDKPLRNEPVRTDDGGLDWLTKSGHRAYWKLIGIMYELANMGIISDNEANRIIDHLDEITSRDNY